LERTKEDTGVVDVERLEESFLRAATHIDELALPTAKTAI
jgi:hypothetical protein